MKCIILASTITLPSMRLITPLLLLLLVVTQAFAQDSTLIISQPIDIPHNGWNKVLQLNNGKTMLFHFENKKKPRLFIYNNKGELISTIIDEYKLIDMNRLDLCVLGGLFEIEGKINMILYQELVDDISIVRIQYDSNGKKLCEVEVEKTGHTNKIEDVAFLFNKGFKEYHIVKYSNAMDMDSVALSISTYNPNHMRTRLIAYKIAKKGIDGARLLAAELSKTGSIYTVIRTGKRLQRSNYGESALYLLHIPLNYSRPIVSKFTLPVGNGFNDVYIRENPFANTVNYYFSRTDRIEEQQKLGVLNWLPYESISLLVANPDMTINKETNIAFDMVRKSILKDFEGDTIKGNRKLPFLNYISTDDNGVTVILQNEWWYKELNNYGVRTYWNNVFMTKYNDDGVEMYGIALPTGKHIVIENQYDNIMGLNINHVYQESFAFGNKKNVFYVFNENSDNFNKSLKDDKSDIINYEKTDAVFYQISRKNIVTKKYLLGETTGNEHRQICSYTQDFDENTNVLSAIARVVKNDKETLHVIWKHLDYTVK